MESPVIRVEDTLVSVDALETQERELLEQVVQFYGPLPATYGEDRTSALYRDAHARLAELR